MQGMDMDELDEFNRKLDDLQKNGEEGDAGEEVAMEDLLTPAFMQRHTDFHNFPQMFEQSGIASKAEIGGDTWNNFVVAHCRFSGWDTMLDAAGEDWTARQLHV